MRNDATSDSWKLSTLPSGMANWTRSRVKDSLKTTSTERQHHEDSQIELAPIKSSPPTSPEQYQHFLKHQNGASERQSRETSMFPDIRISCEPLSETSECSSRLNILSGQKEGVHEDVQSRAWTPSSKVGPIDYFVGSSPTPAPPSHGTNLSVTQAEPDISSSPPRSIYDSNSTNSLPDVTELPPDLMQEDINDNRAHLEQSILEAHEPDGSLDMLPKIDRTSDVSGAALLQRTKPLEYKETNSEASGQSSSAEQQLDAQIEAEILAQEAKRTMFTGALIEQTPINSDIPVAQHVEVSSLQPSALSPSAVAYSPEIECLSKGEGFTEISSGNTVSHIADSFAEVDAVTSGSARCIRIESENSPTSRNSQSRVTTNLHSSGQKRKAQGIDYFSPIKKICSFFISSSQDADAELKQLSQPMQEDADVLSDAKAKTDRTFEAVLQKRKRNESLVVAAMLHTSDNHITVPGIHSVEQHQESQEVEISESSPANCIDVLPATGNPNVPGSLIAEAGSSHEEQHQEVVIAGKSCYKDATTQTEYPGSLNQNVGTLLPQIEARRILQPKSIMARLKGMLSDLKTAMLGSEEEREIDDLLFEIRKEVYESGRRGREEGQKKV
jgi:hypothetical protein